MTPGKGKVESGVGHAQKTPLKGLRFESLEEAQAHLDRWEERWADTRIHGTTSLVGSFLPGELEISAIVLALISRAYTVHRGATKHQMVITPCRKQRGLHAGDPWAWQLPHPLVERAPGRSNG